MRTALGMLIGLAVLVDVPASFAQESRVLGHGNSAGTRIEAEARQTHHRPVSNAGISLAVPIGRVSVGPEFLNGEPIYVRRTTAGAGMTIVEVSTTPFMPVLPSNEEAPGVHQPIVRPDQPASW